MKTHSFLFLCLFLNQFMSIKSAGYYKYLNGRNYRSRSDCFCGFNKEHFADAFGDKYCCLHQDSCQIDGPPYEKWCPNATLMSMNHRCNSFCFDNSMNVCPSNPEACMHFKYGCDGRQRCEAFCAGPLENFPYYDHTAKKCIYGREYCGKRDEAKYHNHQCFTVPQRAVPGQIYAGLN